MLGEMEGASPPDLARIASNLEDRLENDSLRHLRERDLKAAAFAAYVETFGVAPVETKIATPGWPSLGRSTTDLVLDRTLDARKLTTIAELKWIRLDGAFKVWEALWDLFKMALQSQIDSIEDAYLITGAPSTAWSSDPCEDLFQTKSHDVEALCSTVFPTSRSNRPVWDYLLEGGYDRYPEWVPSPIRTEQLPTVQVTSGADQWDLKAVRVTVPKVSEPVPFPNGWPNGKRPPSARQPTIS
jgi:hypothetical protein